MTCGKSLAQTGSIVFDIYWMRISPLPISSFSVSKGFFYALESPRRTTWDHEIYMSNTSGLFETTEASKSQQQMPRGEASDPTSTRAYHSRTPVTTMKSNPSQPGKSTKGGKVSISRPATVRLLLIHLGCPHWNLGKRPMPKTSPRSEVPMVKS